MCFLLLIARLDYNKREPNWIGLPLPLDLSSFLFKRDWKAFGKQVGKVSVMYNSQDFYPD